MIIPPPFEVPTLIVQNYPELLMVADQQQSAVKQFLSDAPDLEGFRQIIQQQGAPSASGGWATESPTSDGLTQLDLSPQTLKALPKLLSQVLNPVMDDATLQGYCWTVQQGVVPGPESVGSSSQKWSLTSLNPYHGLVIASVDYSTANRTFSVDVANKMARHLGVYARFFNSGKQVMPSGWTSKLPSGVPESYESDKLSFLTVLTPDTRVAGIDVANNPKDITVTLPENADSVEFIFGGLGNGQWDSLADSAGTLLTFVLDYAIPTIVGQSGNTVSSLPKLPSWFAKLLNDEQVMVQVLSAGESLVNDPGITDTSTMLGVLAAKLPGLMLDDALKPLQKSIDKIVGVDAVKNAAPVLGWSASTLQSLVDAQIKTDDILNETSSQLLGVPSTFVLDLSPSTTIDLQVRLQADPGWRSQAASYAVDIEYAGGFTQKQIAKLSPSTTENPLTVSFTSVRNCGDIDIAASVFDKKGNVTDSAVSSSKKNASKSERVVEAPMLLQSEPVILGEGSQFVHAGTLTYADNKYVWDSNTSQPTAVEEKPDSQSPNMTVMRVVGISIQNKSRCLGYSWQVSGQGIQSCSGGSPLSQAYFIQNIGIVRTASQQKTADCGFVQQPYLTYGEINHQPAGFFVDPRSSGFYLRDVEFSAGKFNLDRSTSRGQLREASLSSITVHPAGFVAAVSESNCRLELVKLSLAPVADAEAPFSRLLSGVGTRPGLMNAPVAIAVTPQGFLLVLEQGNSRVQAFDTQGNPVSLFNNSPFLKLEIDSQIHYLDLAVSQAGYIYILMSKNGGTVPSDFYLNVYTPDGTRISSTGGINAARIVVDQFETVYTVNYGSIMGRGGRIEPSLSVWNPAATS